MLLRIVILNILAFTLTACTMPGAVMWCVDSKIPRPTINRTFSFEIYDTNGSAISDSTISCQKLYDANCSVRGNYYRYELTSASGDSRFSTPLDNGDSIEFTLPSCKTLLTKDKTHHSHFGRRYIDADSGERRNNMMYVYEGAEIGEVHDLPEGFIYLDKNRQPTSLGLLFSFKRSTVD